MISQKQRRVVELMEQRQALQASSAAGSWQQQQQQQQPAAQLTHFIMHLQPGKPVILF